MKQKIKNKDEILECNLSTVLGAVRGSSGYWNRVCDDLSVMDENLGPATFFASFSISEYGWVDLHEFLKILNQDMRTKNSNDLCKADPVGIAMFFENKFQAFLHCVILNELGPLGKVKYFFYRREYQARGAPHIHLKCWTENAPLHGKNSNEEVLNFINKHITCSIPDPYKSPELYDLVMKYQVHTCTPSCIRPIFGKKKFQQKCRYGFPREPCSKTSMNTLEQTITSRKKGCYISNLSFVLLVKFKFNLGNKPIKLYNLKRSVAEMYINDYNPVLLLLWKGNIDLQYIHEKSLVLNRYITSYVTKSEQVASQALWEEVNHNKSLRSSLKSFALKSLKNRQIGVYEIADKLLGYSLYDKNVTIKYLSEYFFKLSEI